MTVAGWIEILLFLAVLTALTPVVGGYMARVFRGEVARARLRRARRSTALLGVDPARGQDWKAYARSVLIFERRLRRPALRVIRARRACSPATRRTSAARRWDLSFNTTASFLTNTNWQFYAGETTMSYFSQMAGLAVQNFVSAGVGIAVLVAFIRGLASRSGKELGVFYVDLTRTILYVLLPLSIVVGLVLVSQGVIQTLQGHGRRRPTLTGGHADLRLRAGRRPGGDQDARHQRRRLLQRQLGDALREPDVALELRRDARDPDHPGRPHRDVRPHGRQPAPGLDGLRRDDVALRRRGRGDLRRRVRPDPGDAGRRPDRRQPRGQGAALRHRLHARCSPPSPPPPRAARSTPRWSRSAASAARSRWRR